VPLRLHAVVVGPEVAARITAAAKAMKGRWRMHQDREDAEAAVEVALTVRLGLGAKLIIARILYM